MREVDYPGIQFAGFRLAETELLVVRREDGATKKARGRQAWLAAELLDDNGDGLILDSIMEKVDGRWRAAAA